MTVIPRSAPPSMPPGDCFALLAMTELQSMCDTPPVPAPTDQLFPIPETCAIMASRSCNREKTAHQQRRLVSVRSAGALLQMLACPWQPARDRRAGRETRAAQAQQWCAGICQPVSPVGAESWLAQALEPLAAERSSVVAEPSAWRCWVQGETPGSGRHWLDTPVRAGTDEH